MPIGKSTSEVTQPGAPTSPVDAAIGIEIARPTTKTARSFALAVTVAVLVAPAVYQHYLALLVLPLILGLGAGVPVKAIAVAYFLMWGGQQDALGDLSWIVNRAMPTLGAIVLLASLGWRYPRRAEASIERASSSAIP